MNAQEAAKLSEESVAPSKELIQAIFKQVKSQASRGIRYTSLDLKPFDLSREQLEELKLHLTDLGYSLKVDSSYQGTFYTLRW